MPILLSRFLVLELKIILDQFKVIQYDSLYCGIMRIKSESLNSLILVRCVNPQLVLINLLKLFLFDQIRTQYHCLQLKLAIFKSAYLSSGINRKGVLSAILLTETAFKKPQILDYSPEMVIRANSCLKSFFVFLMWHLIH